MVKKFCDPTPSERAYFVLMPKNKTSNPELRRRVLLKTNCRCAYCGIELSDSFQVDHIEPKRRYKNPYPNVPVIRGGDNEENLFACCASCNSSKSDLSIDDFRDRVYDRLNRLRNYSGEYNIAKRYGLVIENPKPIIFYFETLFQDAYQTN